MIHLDPQTLAQKDLYAYLVASVAPRPIAFVSSSDKAGNLNLAPFSYFTVASIRPPKLLFNPCKSGRTNTHKDTLLNVRENPFCTINIVTHHIVEQMSLASAEYEKGINEFDKSGFTALDSECVNVPRVKESLIQFECSVDQILEMGQEGGAGNLVICDVLKIHVDESVLNEQQKIDQTKLEHVSRLGGAWYSLVSPDNLFEVDRPAGASCIGIDGLPHAIRNSTVLSGNDLAQLANLLELPEMNATETAIDKSELERIFAITDQVQQNNELHAKAKVLLKHGKLNEAWQVLLLSLESKRPV